MEVMGEGIGYGKVILFSEHFVVHNIPAIASAIGDTTVARVKPSANGLVLLDERNATPNYKLEKKRHQEESLRYIFDAMNVDDNLEIWLGGNLRAASGVGASAASCAAIARAIDDEFNMGCSDEEINRVTYEGERGYHGNPSGLDNTVATFGGLVWFQSGTMNKLKSKEPVEIVMGDTGIVANTKKAVAGVQERREQNRGQYNRIFNQAEELVFKAREEFTVGNWQQVGKYMDENHELLQQIGVSSNELDRLVNIARRNGAYGAKMTGGGLGGYMVALTPGKNLQTQVAQAIEQAGFEVVRTIIGV